MADLPIPVDNDPESEQYRKKVLRTGRYKRGVGNVRTLLHSQGSRMSYVSSVSRFIAENLGHDSM